MSDPYKLPKDLAKLVEMEINFPKAIELLKECLEEYSDHSLRNKIEQFLEKMNDKAYKLVCSTCGGTNIQTKAWIDPNSDNVLDSCSDGEWEDNWCDDCDNHCSFNTINLEEDAG